MSSGFRQQQPNRIHRREQQFDSRGAQRQSSRPKMSHPLRERLNTAEGSSLESPEVHRLYTTADGMFTGDVPMLKYGPTVPSHSHRRKPHPHERSQLRSTAGLVPQGHRRGYDVPPAVPTPHHGDNGIAVTRQPVKAVGETSRLTRQDSLASYWLSCGSSLSSLTTLHNRQPEFHFDWRNRSQRTLETNTMGTVPPDHYILEPMISSSEGRSDPTRSSNRKPPAVATVQHQDESNMVTDSDNSQPSRTTPPVAPFASFPTETTSPRDTVPPRVSSMRHNNMVDVGGGLFLQLRGADETLRAIRNDFFSPCSCSCCQQMLFCILDADYVICPTCRVVSPVAADEAQHRLAGGGVGLGFTMEQLAHHQKEISRQLRR